MPDLLKAKNISLQIKETSKEIVMAHIAPWLLKLSEAIGDTLHKERSRLETLCEDIIDTYTYESLEDIRECLKKGRRGLYGWGHNKRAFISMQIIKEWMAHHLEDKAIEREKQHEQRKKNLRDIEDEEFDAVKFYESGKAYRQKIAKMKEKRKHQDYKIKEYEEFKMQYLESRKK